MWKPELIKILEGIKTFEDLLPMEEEDMELKLNLKKIEEVIKEVEKESLDSYKELKDNSYAEGAIRGIELFCRFLLTSLQKASTKEAIKEKDKQIDEKLKQLVILAEKKRVDFDG